MEYLSFDYSNHRENFALPTMQSHDFYEFYFLLEGERNLIIEDRMYHAIPGTVAVIPPYTLHKTEGGPFRRINIYASASLIDGHETEFLSFQHGCCFLMTPEQARIITELLMQCFDEDNNPLPRLKVFGASVLQTILFLLSSRPLRPLAEDGLIRSKKEADDLALKMSTYIKENFSEDISLALLSRVFHLSRVTICSRFRAVMNCSVMEYVAQTRLNHAKHLLSDTDKPVELIAELCGYSSANYFSLIFKRTVGIPPTAFRKINRSPR